MHTTLCSAVLVAALLSACNSNPAGPDPQEQLALHREFAQAYFQSGQLAQAENQTDQGLAIEPRDNGLLMTKGWIRLKRGTRDDVLLAEKLFRDLSGGDDHRASLGLAEALERKGVLYWGSAANVESGATVTKAADPAKRGAEMRAAANGFWEESTQWYERALAQRPDNIPALNGLQRVWALRGDLARSLEWSEKLLAQSETEIAYWRTELARPDLRASDEAQYRGLLAGSSKLLVETRLQASTALVQLNRKADAIAQLDAALQLDPTKADVYSRRAQLRRDLGSMREARDDVQEFLKRSALPVEHPDVQRALDLLAECELALRGAAATAR